ncbi:hypothetical protein [Streptomyces sp. NPDC056453]|uniref:hypothetical protein n=1 Tax=Streptomyces sp. NPDC056453 TaxID=3345822 RepID=UPI00368EBF2B
MHGGCMATALDEACALAAITRCHSLPDGESERGPPTPPTWRGRPTGSWAP